MRRPRPHQIVFAIGVGAAVFTIASGILPAITHWHHDSPIQREAFTNVPDRAEGRVLRVGLGDAPHRRVARVAARPQLRARRARRPPHEPQERQAPLRRLPLRRVDAHAAARSRRGIMHSCIYFGFIGLFMVTVVIEIDHQLPGLAEVPARPRVRGVLGVRRRGRRAVPRRHRVGDRAPLRAAPVPHPHQDQARRRGDPRHVPAHRAHRVLHRGQSASRSSAGPRSRSGRSSAIRSRA